MKRLLLVGLLWGGCDADERHDDRPAGQAQMVAAPGAEVSAAEPPPAAASRPAPAPVSAPDAQPPSPNLDAGVSVPLPVTPQSPPDAAHFCGCGHWSEAAHACEVSRGEIEPGSACCLPILCPPAHPWNRATCWCDDGPDAGADGS